MRSLQPDKVKIGQVWIRNDGRLVKTTKERIHENRKEIEITPIHKGRKAWRSIDKFWVGLTYVRTLNNNK